MKKITVRMEITEWAEFELGARGQLLDGNRLSNQDLEALRESVWIDA